MNEDSVTYDASSGLYHVDISMDGPGGVVDAVVCGVADILDEDLLSLPPLEQVVDTDSLNRIFHSTGDSVSDVTVSFEYSGFVVTVHDHGRIHFEEIE